MSLHNLDTTLTPAEHTALWNVVTRMMGLVSEKRAEALQTRTEMGDSDVYLYQDCETARLWLSAQSEKLYQEWESLPAGSHLKDAYREQVWTWSDRDLEAIPEVNPADFAGVERPAYPPEEIEQ